jgi:integrase
MSHSFHYLDKDWTLFKKKATDAHYQFAPRWGDRGQKKWHAMKDKETGRALTQVEAEAAARELIAARFKGPDQYQALRNATKLREQETVAPLLAHYLASQCPDTDKQPRTGGALATEQRHIAILLRWWGVKIAANITDKDQDDYHTWRLATVKRGTGHRTTELELGTLKNALRWAVRTGKIERMPLTQAYRFRDPKKIRHAREFMPRSGDELHILAGALFLNPDTEVYGWLCLLEAYTGLRGAEARALLAAPKRLDPIAKPLPGHIDARNLYVVRAKRGRNPKIRLDDPERPELRPLLERILKWHAARHPDSPWLLPRPDGGQLTKEQFTKILSATATRLGLPERHGHGLRAYYASVRLAQGTSPDDVARELGQGSGDEMVRDIYGVDPDDFDAENWKALVKTFTWLPSTADTAPAWNRLTIAPGKIVHL